MIRTSMQNMKGIITTGCSVVVLGWPIIGVTDQFNASLQYKPVLDHPAVLWREPISPTHQRTPDALMRTTTQTAAATTQDLLDRLLPASTSVPRQSGNQAISGQGLVRENLDMFVGEVKVLGQRKIDRVAIGQGAVIRADVLDSDELLVIAEAAGSSSLRLWYSDGHQADYNIRVTGEDPETRFRMEKMVKMRVRMVEFRKSALTRLGIDWADSLTGPTISAAGDAVSNTLFRPEFEDFSGLPLAVDPVAAYFGIASNLTSRINAMALDGDAKILAEPVLSGTNGGIASFLAGGEVPYPTVGANGEPIVDFKEYGIRLEVEPRIDSGGNVLASIQTEISQLDPTVTVQGAPGLLTRRAHTQVNVKSGQTIVISGLLSSEVSKDIARLPGIGRLPVLGRLFRSDNVRNNVSELVIFITPEVIDPAVLTLTQRELEFHESAERQLHHDRTTQMILD